MPSLDVSNVYISAAFNRVTHTADWAQFGQSSTLLYASNKSVAVWTTPDLPASHVTNVVQTGFAKPISALKLALLQDASPPVAIVGSGDGSIAILASQDGVNWMKKSIVKHAHTGSVSALGVLSPSSNTAGNLFVSGASDGLLKMWTVDQTWTPVLQQTIDLKSRFPLDVALLELPSDNQADPRPQYLMALATTTSKIDLYATQTSAVHFVHKLTLEGHEDWVRSLDLCRTHTGGSHTDTIMLASGSQDASVRLWKIAPAHNDVSAVDHPNHTSVEEGGDEFERMVSKIEADRLNQNGEISTRAFPFQVERPDAAPQRWAVTFDALLIGHDNWITGVRWHPSVSTPSGDTCQSAALLSSSADNSLILWTPSSSHLHQEGGTTFAPFDTTLLSSGGAKKSQSGPTAHHIASSIWMPLQRFGEVGGASNLGFFGAMWMPCRSDQSSDGPVSAVVAHGWGGSAHIWTLPRTSTAQQQWDVASPVSGHFSAARSVAWEPCGEYLLSCSDDQTTRLHAQPFSTTPTAAATTASTWHEVARPQSHGYDLHAVSWLDRLNFVSAADEKVLRVFSAPRGFVGTVAAGGLACANLGTELESRDGLLAARPSSQTLLCLNLDPAIGLLQSAQRHGDLLCQAMTHHFTSHQDTLTAVVTSSLFEQPVSQHGASFKQIELYLKWMYAQAWSVAIKKDYMLADINILLCPTSRLESTLRSLLTHASTPTMLIDETNPSEALRTVVQQIAASPPIAISSSRTYDEDSEVVGTDDGKGLVTYPVVALGGTFDHLHVGHKILLSMATILAEKKLIVGVTDDAMLTKKSNAHLLEPIDQRIATVNAFIALFRLASGVPLEREVVKLEDVAGPAATEADLQALVVTDETLSGADYIGNKRQENQLGPLENWVIGVVGSEGETNLHGDAKALAESKIGSTAIRKWISRAGPRRTHALDTITRSRTARYLNLTNPTVASSDEAKETRPVGASVPPLGLSNRAVFEGTTRPDEAPSASGQPIGTARESLAAVLHAPPSEEQLAVETLWPELEKLYGHGYEMLWVNANPGSAVCTAGRFVASCCRASNADHAVVRLHDRQRNWKECAQLAGHTLSVTRIQWSSDSRFLLSCSRDRSWRIYERKTAADQDEGQDEFVAYTGERSHARIIWDADWCKDVAHKYTFATASRDKSVKIFRLDADDHNATARAEKPFQLLQTIQLPDSAATSIAFGVGGLLAIGKENGSVVVYQREDQEWAQVAHLVDLASDQITQLQFRPPVVQDGDDALLACASQDGTVRIVRLAHLL